jgi:hypothetical protein
MFMIVRFDAGVQPLPHLTHSLCCPTVDPAGVDAAGGGHHTATVSADDVPTELWEALFKKMDSGLSADAAARDSGVCYRTLQRRYDKRDSSATRHGPEPALTMHGEELFAGWLDYCHARGISPTVKRTKKTAKELAEKAGIAGFTASSSWLQGFYRRNPRFATKTAELLEASRRKGVTQEALKPFYDIIWDLLVVKKIPPENIFNLDEAGIELINAMAKVRRPATRPTAILPADVLVAHCRSSRPRSRAGRGCAARDVVQGGIW